MAEVPTTQRTVLAHALNLEEDWRLNNAADEQSVSALCGVPRGVALVGDEIHKEGPYAIQRKDDLDTCVVSGPLPDILRCLSTSSLRAPAHDQQHIPATSKLQPIIDGERDVSLEIAPQGLDGHPSTRWGPSFAVLNIMDRGYLYCFPVRRRESEKLDMGIYLLVLWTLLRGSPPKAPVEVIKEALHNPGSSVPIGQSYDVLFAQIQEEPAAVPLQVFSSKEKNALNPKKAYSALTATALDQLANVLGDADLVSSLLDRLLGPVWREEQLYLPDFITKGVHG